MTDKVPSPTHPIAAINTAVDTAVDTAVKLFNTAKRALDELKPIEAGVIKLYCCGPTVYNYQHVGNLRTYIFEDLLARTLRYAGYRVQHVMNITDVGHLVSDADQGEDKMLVASRREQKSSQEIADYYTKIFFDHCAQLNIQRPDVVCKATEHIPEMIALIEQLFEKGMAYESGGNIYFEVAKFTQYGDLARLDLENLQAGARIDVDEKKRGALDFALWFTKSKFENQELQWDSPWGRGYPGWHIECSAMSMKYLGEQFDIHCGGIDHIPVHHTNEIAQSQCATGKPLSNVWMHGGFLLSDKEKMSKSSGVFLTLDRIIEKGFEPLTYRLFCLGSNYRNELVFSWEGLESAERNLKKFRANVISWKNSPQTSSAAGNEGLEHLRQEFRDALFNDLGLAKAMASVHALIGAEQLSDSEKLALFLEFDLVLGLGAVNWVEEVVTLPSVVQELVGARQTARAEKRWADADKLRAQVLELGFTVEDSPAGPIVKPK